MAVRGAAAGALGAGGYLAYKNRDKIVPFSKQGLAKTGSLARQAEQSLLQKATAANVPYSQTPGVAGILRKAAGKGSSLLGKAAKNIEKLATAFTRKDIDRIVELAARITDLEAREFGDPEPQRSKLGIAATGGVQALYDRGKYKKSGLVYRKRDALVDSTKGGLANAGTTAAALGAGYGVSKLAASNKLPKGALRQGAVKIAQTLKKRPLTAALGAAGAATAAGLAVQHGSAEKRRKALLMQRLQGAQS